MSKREGRPLHVRVSEEERATIEKHAATAGLKFSEYVRQAALGEWDAILAAKTSPPSTASEPRAAVSASSPAEGEPSMAKRVELEEVAAEVEEAAQPDDAAHDSFLERRTLQLVGQGKTTKVARSLAEAEWRQRGDPA